jgi:hypothetical protein
MNHTGVLQRSSDYRETGTASGAFSDDPGSALSATSAVVSDAGAASTAAAATGAGATYGKAHGTGAP